MKVSIGRYPKDHTKERKIDVRIDNWDVWSLYHTLSLIIHPALVKLKEIQHGAGSVDPEDVPEELRAENELWFKRWEYVIDEMIFAFGEIKDQTWEDQFHTGEHDLMWIPLDKDYKPIPDVEPLPWGSKIDVEADFYEIGHGPNDTHVFDHEGYMKHQNRIQNGLKLFGKYFLSLWD